MDNIQSSIEECTQAVEDGKNEIIEILNSRANTKGKAQRFDAMKEQLDIRKAGISQRILSLKTQEEEQQSAIDQAQKEYDTITKAIQETRGRRQPSVQKRYMPSRKTLNNRIHSWKGTDVLS